VKGYTCLDNAEDMALLMALPNSALKPVLLLMQHRKLKNPVVALETFVQTCGISARQVYRVLAGLSCVKHVTGGWVLADRNVTAADRNVTDSDRNVSADCQNCQDSVTEMSQTPRANPVQDEAKPPLKLSSEVKKREVKELQLQLDTHPVKGKPGRSDFARPQPPNARGRLLLSLREQNLDLEQRFNLRLRVGMREAAWFDWLDTLIPHYERLGNDFPAAVAAALDALASNPGAKNPHRYFVGVLRNYAPPAPSGPKAGPKTREEIMDEICREVFGYPLKEHRPNAGTQEAARA
jgi:hypothetical protein